jgi:hypothetical protein
MREKFSFAGLAVRRCRTGQTKHTMSSANPNQNEKAHNRAPKKSRAKPRDRDLMHMETSDLYLI